MYIILINNNSDCSRVRDVRTFKQKADTDQRWFGRGYWVQFVAEFHGYLPEEMLEEGEHVGGSEFGIKGMSREMHWPCVRLLEGDG